MRGRFYYGLSLYFESRTTVVQRKIPNKIGFRLPVYSVICLPHEEGLTDVSCSPPL